MPGDQLRGGQRRERAASRGEDPGIGARLIASNGTASRVGSRTTDWQRFLQGKRIERDKELRRRSAAEMPSGTCLPQRLLDLVENCMLFSGHKGGLEQLLGQNHHFLDVNNALACILEAHRLDHGCGGVLWQAQGRGKTFSLVCRAQKVPLRRQLEQPFGSSWHATHQGCAAQAIAASWKPSGRTSEAATDCREHVSSRQSELRSTN